MSRSLFRTSGGLALITAAIGLGLTACHSGTPAASSPASTASTQTATTASTATSAPASSGTASTATSSATSPAAGSGSGATTVAYFPDTVGDTWVYQVSLNGETGTDTNRVTAVAPTTGGTLVTMATSETLLGVPVSHTYEYIVHPDGSITVPFASTDSNVTVKSGQLNWPSPAELTSGQATTATLVMSTVQSGTTTTYTADFTVKGGGTQTVTVPAGTYSATIINEAMTSKIEGYTSTGKFQTWVANGVGPVKEVDSTGIGSETLTITEVLKSFTKG